MTIRLKKRLYNAFSVIINANGDPDEQAGCYDAAMATQRRSGMSPDERAQVARVGRAIAVLRAELGLSRSDLSERAGLSYPYASEIETGSFSLINCITGASRK